MYSQFTSLLSNNRLQHKKNISLNDLLPAIYSWTKTFLYTFIPLEIEINYTYVSIFFCLLLYQAMCRSMLPTQPLTLSRVQMWFCTVGPCTTTATMTTLFVDSTSPTRASQRYSYLKTPGRFDSLKHLQLNGLK